MRNSKEIAQKIETELKRKDMKPVELAKKMEVDRSTISRYLNGTRKISMEEIPKIANALGLTPIDLLVAEEPTNYEVAKPETVKIPVLGEIACGDPILVEENVSEYRHESPDRLPAGELYYVKAKGDSMEPTIPDGSYVLIREQPEVENGEIAAVLLNDDTEVTLKRIKKQDGLVLLVPENSSYEAHIITENSPAKILGRAIRFTQDL